MIMPTQNEIRILQGLIAIAQDDPYRVIEKAGRKRPIISIAAEESEKYARLESFDKSSQQSLTDSGEIIALIEDLGMMHATMEPARWRKRRKQ